MSTITLAAGVVLVPRGGPPANFLGAIIAAPDGTLFTADTSWGVIYRIDPNGVVSGLVGDSAAAAIMDGPGATSRFWDPGDIALDGMGGLVVPDCAMHTIPRVTFAGSGRTGAINRALPDADFRWPMCVAIDHATGLIYVVDSQNNQIRRIDVNADRVTTIAGDPAGGYADGAPLLARR